MMMILIVFDESMCYDSLSLRLSSSLPSLSTTSLSSTTTSLSSSSIQSIDILKLYSNQHNRNNPWTALELNQLITMRINGHSWENISNNINNRTAYACMQKYNVIMKQNVRFTKEEQEVIILKLYCSI